MSHGAEFCELNHRAYWRSEIASRSDHPILLKSCEPPSISLPFSLPAGPGSRPPVFKIEWISSDVRNSRQLDLLLLKLGAEPRMNHPRALQSGLGSLDRLKAERIHLESKRNQFKQLREEFIDRADLCCSCKRQRPGQAKARSSRERIFLVS